QSVGLGFSADFITTAASIASPPLIDGCSSFPRRRYVGQPATDTSCYSLADSTLISSGGTKHKQSLHVPRHGHKAPFALDPIETAQQELPEAQHRLDDAEHRLRHLFAQGVELSAVGRLQLVCHGLDGGRVLRWRRRVFKASAKDG